MRHQAQQVRQVQWATRVRRARLALRDGQGLPDRRDYRESVDFLGGLRIQVRRVEQELRGLPDLRDHRVRQVLSPALRVLTVKLQTRVRRDIRDRPESQAQLGLPDSQVRQARQAGRVRQAGQGLPDSQVRQARQAGRVRRGGQVARGGQDRQVRQAGRVRRDGRVARDGQDRRVRLDLSIRCQPR